VTFDMWIVAGEALLVLGVCLIPRRSRAIVKEVFWPKKSRKGT
jgi:hypothetical protein